MPKYSGPERRKYKRVRVSLTVVFRKNAPPNVLIRDDEGEYNAVMIDIGEGGMAIHTAANIDIGTEIVILFSLLDTVGKMREFYGNFKLTGKVTSNVNQGDDSYRLGIAFVTMDEQTKREIVNFVEVINSRSQDKP